MQCLSTESETSGIKKENNITASIIFSHHFKQLDLEVFKAILKSLNLKTAKSQRQSYPLITLYDLQMQTHCLVQAAWHHG